jgi:peroxiredoxin
MIRRPRSQRQSPPSRPNLPDADARRPGRRDPRRGRRNARGASPSRLALAPFLALLVLACGAGGGPVPGNVAEGAPAPTFRLASLDGRQLGPEDFAGEVVLVEFWATWCPPCHLQADILRPLYPEYRQRGVEFLAVDLGEDEETVRRFVADRPFPYPVLIDPEDELSYELGVQALPTLMIVDRAGEVTYFRPGVLEEDELRKVLAGAGAA